MGDKTSIEWTEATLNVSTGCTKVSEGCDNCYAETIAHRFAGTPAYPNAFELTLRPERLALPLRWKRPRRIFVDSMSDLFHKDVPDEYIARLWAVMAAAPQHTFQILTKRPGRMRSLLNSTEFKEAVKGAHVFYEPNPMRDWDDLLPVWPLPNAWLGTSVESQKWADVRIPQLLGTPAAVRFLSMEPLLGGVLLCRCDGAAYEVRAHPFIVNPECPLHGSVKLDWVIVGGESGPKARPMHPDWARSLRDQCVAAGVAFHYKQHGEWVPVEPDVGRNRRESDWLVRMDGYAWPLAEPHGAEDGTEVTVRRVGKKAAGRLLDGRTWDEFPAPRVVAS